MRMSPRWKELILLFAAAVIPFVGWVSLDLAQEGHIVAGNIVYPLLLTGMFFLAHMVLRFFRPDADPILLPLVAALCYLGVVLLFRLNAHMARLQVTWLAVGVTAMLVLVAVLKDYRVLERYRYTLAVAGLV